MTPRQEAYQEYLKSDEWRERRGRRLQLSDGKCEVCGSVKGLEVHHITYDRIFNEHMEDLMVVCYRHHRTAHNLRKRQATTRAGIIKNIGKLERKRSKKAKHPSRNRGQESLMNEWWFKDALLLQRNQFKKLVKNMYATVRIGSFCSYMSNCFALYRRHHRRSR